MALNTRFVQKAGVDPPVAVSSVGLNFVAGVIMHVVLLVTFAVWAGRDAFGSISLPDPAVALYGLAVVAVFAGISFAVPAVRHQITGRVLPVLGRAFGGIGRTMQHPTKVALLFGGSALVTLSFLVALFFSIEAFGGSELCQGRDDLPGGRGSGHVGPDAGRLGRARGGPHRRLGRGGSPQRDRSSGRLPLPPRDVLDPDPSRMDQPHVPAAGRVRVDGARVEIRRVALGRRCPVQARRSVIAAARCRSRR
jgi:hypothetical protein